MAFYWLILCVGIGKVELKCNKNSMSTTTYNKKNFSHWSFVYFLPTVTIFLLKTIIIFFRFFYDGAKMLTIDQFRPSSWANKQTITKKVLGDIFFLKKKNWRHLFRHFMREYFPNFWFKQEKQSNKNWEILKLFLEGKNKFSKNYIS